MSTYIKQIGNCSFKVINQKPLFYKCLNCSSLLKDLQLENHFLDCEKLQQIPVREMEINFFPLSSNKFRKLECEQCKKAVDRALLLSHATKCKKLSQSKIQEELKAQNQTNVQTNNIQQQQNTMLLVENTQTNANANADQNSKQPQEQKQQNQQQPNQLTVLQQQEQVQEEQKQNQLQSEQAVQSCKEVVYSADKIINTANQIGEVGLDNKATGKGNSIQDREIPILEIQNLQSNNADQQQSQSNQISSNNNQQAIQGTMLSNQSNSDSQQQTVQKQNITLISQIVSTLNQMREISLSNESEKRNHNNLINNQNQSSASNTQLNNANLLQSTQDQNYQSQNDIPNIQTLEQQMLSIPQEQAKSSNTQNEIQNESDNKQITNLNYSTFILLKNEEENEFLQRSRQKALDIPQQNIQITDNQKQPNITQDIQYQPANKESNQETSQSNLIQPNDTSHFHPQQQTNSQASIQAEIHNQNAQSGIIQEESSSLIKKMITDKLIKDIEKQTQNQRNLEQEQDQIKKGNLQQKLLSDKQVNQNEILLPQHQNPFQTQNPQERTQINEPIQSERQEQQQNDQDELFKKRNITKQSDQPITQNQRKNNNQKADISTAINRLQKNQIQQKENVEQRLIQSVKKTIINNLTLKQTKNVLHQHVKEIKSSFKDQESSAQVSNQEQFSLPIKRQRIESECQEQNNIEILNKVSPLIILKRIQKFKSGVNYLIGLRKNLFYKDLRKKFNCWKQINSLFQLINAIQVSSNHFIRNESIKKLLSLIIQVILKSIQEAAF